GLRSGWDAFVAVVLGIVYVLAVLLPFLVVMLVIAGLAWLVLRRRPTRVMPARPEARLPDDTLSEEPDRGPATPVG
ncbi:MAG TPA: hypothetical protein VF065_02315, partial [Ilumatobacter sp.]